MTGYNASQTHPVSLPPAIEDIVTRGLQRFAESAGFDLRALYHGESLWYAEKRENSTVRRIQVAAFGSPPELRFIPDVSEVDDAAGVIRTSDRTPPELIQALPVQALSVENTPEDAVAVVERTAWDALKSLSAYSYPKLTRVISIRQP